ncbi:MAG: glutamate--tRNA ligase [Oxalobacter sp.]|nr:glutamate--tRNA ligase [Oxalobacter sp.]
MTVRTRFAPSPTGFLHLGGARTALYSWAYARHHKGTFVLRIEDTDVERSTDEAVQAIIDGMQWLGLQHDEGPFYQMKRMDRYREVIGQMLKDGTAYYCYCSPEELDAMRERQKAAGEIPRYDGTWRPEPGKVLPPVPEGVNPVVRFRNPLDGVVTWHDRVKGDISIANSQLDDLIIARSDGTPTYNFCVVIDDWDMGITHVIRGDDHVNNTPRQINMLKALNAPVPEYAHLPMILGDDGEKLSKRHGAVSVMEYPAAGYLPEAMLNYLARLGWSHGDDEIFSMEQFCEWFDFDHLSSSASQFNTEKLNWLNNHYIREADNARLEAMVRPQLEKLGVDLSTGPALQDVIGLMKDRASTVNELASSCLIFYGNPDPDPEVLKEHLTDASREALKEYASNIETIDWNRDALKAMMKGILKQRKMKMPQVAMPLRLLLTGELHTPSIDAVVCLFGRETVLSRLKDL